MRKLLIFLVVLLVLVVGADFGGRWFAESKAGEAIARNAGLTAAPTVSIGGFSFLAQALPGTYTRITISSAGQTLGPLRNVSTHVDLYDVNFPLGDAVNGDVSKLVAGRAELRISVPAAALGAAVNRPALTIAAGANGSVVVSDTLSVGGQSVPVSATLQARVSSGVLGLRAQRVAGQAGDLPGIDALLSRLSLDIPLSGLPVSITTATVSVEEANLVITAQANNVTVAGLR